MRFGLEEGPTHEWKVMVFLLKIGGIRAPGLLESVEHLTLDLSSRLVSSGCQFEPHAGLHAGYHARRSSNVKGQRQDGWRRTGGWEPPSRLEMPHPNIRKKWEVGVINAGTSSTPPMPSAFETSLE